MISVLVIRKLATVLIQRLIQQSLVNYLKQALTSMSPVGHAVPSATEVPGSEVLMPRVASYGP